MQVQDSAASYLEELLLTIPVSLDSTNRKDTSGPWTGTCDTNASLEPWDQLSQQNKSALWHNHAP